MDNKIKILVDEYVENTIADFQRERYDILLHTDFSKLLEQLNPYFLMIQPIKTSEQIIRGIVDAYISSSEETLFGEWLEGLAIFINQKIFEGRKSGITGIDLEFDRDDKRYIVSIKSSPNWGNSRQVSKMKSDFSAAKKSLRTSNPKLNIVAVNGCCYGVDNKPDKGDYFKYCGQEFWTFISGNNRLYLDIIDPLGHKAKERNDEFQKSYNQMINKFTREFSIDFCNAEGEINWNKLVEFNSGKKKEN